MFKQNKPKQFKSKVIKIFILVSLVPLLIISIISLFLVITTRQKNIAELQNLAVDNARDKVTKYLNEKMEGFHLVLSGSTQYQSEQKQQLDMIDPDYLIPLLMNLKNVSGTVNEINFVNKSGDVLLRIDKKNNILVKKYFGEKSISIYDEAKQAEYGIKISFVDYIDNFAFRDDFKVAITGQDYFGQIEIKNNESVLNLASRIEYQNKDIIGAIVGEIGLIQLNSIISQVTLGNTGYVYILDGKSRVISSSNNLFKIGDTVKSGLIESVFKGKVYDGLVDFTTAKNIAGEKIIFAAKPVAPIGWYAVSEWPQEDAYSVINNILKFTIGIIFFTFALIVILTILLVKQIVKPINILSNGVKEIEKGNLNYNIDLKTNDEFEMLGGQFNEMIKVLNENQKLKDEFVFIAAHELRTPVTAIKGYVSMLLDKTFGDIPKPVEDNLKIINQSNDRLVQLVQDLLEVARSQSGKMKIELKEINIRENIKNIIVELKSLADQKGIKVSYNDPGKDIIVSADAYKLNEVLVNLIGNAIKYTLGNGAVDISHEMDGNNLITHIADHGIGMSDEDVKKLFSKFYRIQNEKTAKIEGTGLGLFICKEIIERMNGKIWVKSKLGEGSVFSFSLNLVKK